MNVEFINVQDRTQFHNFLTYMRKASLIVGDTETNGLRYYRDNYIISISVFFPEFNICYNLPFRHGEGKVDIRWNKSNPEGTDFQDASWTGNAKNDMFISYWQQKLADRLDYENLPIEWLEEVKEVWTLPHTHIYHNARFDLHMLRAEGFDTPQRVEDTMVALHLVLEDWAGTKFTAPYKWTDKDKKKGRCSKDQKGQWARDSSGVLQVRKQNGNRSLKWVCAMLQHIKAIDSTYDATVGESELADAMSDLSDLYVEYILAEHLEDPYLNGLVYKTVERKGLEASGMLDKQRDRIRKKFQPDEKSMMWMLPSSDVAYYAMLDVVITWQLREWCLLVIEEWDNVDLWNQQCEITLHASFLMEANGALLDVERALSELETLRPQIEDLQGRYDVLCEANEVEPHSIGSYVKLCAFLNTGILTQELPELLPKWLHADRRANLTVYEEGYILPNTKKETLEQYEDHPLIRLIQDYRKLKASENYLKRWEWARDPDGYVHGGMNQDGTVAGRFSSSGDAGNWQNIPDRNGYTIKRAIIAKPSWLIVANDYGQMEARYAAYVAEGILRDLGVHHLEPVMTNLFNGIYDMGYLRTLNPNIVEANFLKHDGSVDMHSFTREMVDVRSIVFGTRSSEEILLAAGYNLDELDESPDAKVAGMCRQIAKTLNFGLLYNGTKYMVSALLKLDLDVAEVLVQRWKGLFPAFGEAQKYFTDLAMTRRRNPSNTGWAQYVTQPYSGRHRKLTRYATAEWFTDDYGNRKLWNPKEASAKKTWNNVVQGDCGQMTPLSLVRFGKEYDWEGMQPFAIIHDAIESRVRSDMLWKVPELMRIMADFPVNPKFTVDIEAGVNWQDLYEVKDMPLWIDSGGRLGYGKNRQGEVIEMRVA